MAKPLTRLRVGHVPPGWHSIRVFDCDTGDFVQHVTEVDTIGGWLFRYCTDKQGNLIFDEATHAFKTERRVGRFVIMGIRSRK